MAFTKERINIRISKKLAGRARCCAAIRKASLNNWITQAIEAKADQDDEALRVEPLESKRNEVAQEHQPGRVVTVDEMLTMAQTFADEDTCDGILTRMQTPAARAGMKAAFNASPTELGKAAVAAARKRRS